MTKKDLKLLNYQLIPLEEISNLNQIMNLHLDPNDKILGIIEVYLYGVIQGKRQERARRRNLK